MEGRLGGPRPISDVVAGVDLGGTTIKFATADRTGKLLKSECIAPESHRGPGDVLNRIAGTLTRMLHEGIRRGSCCDANDHASGQLYRNQP